MAIYVVADWEIDRLGASNDPRHLFLGDGFHPGTIGQCLIANRFLDAVNCGFGGDVAPLGEAEMVRFAGPVPRPTGLAPVRSGLLALLGHGRRRPRPARAAAHAGGRPRREAA